MVSGTGILDAADEAGPFKEPVALAIFSLGFEEHLHEETPLEFPRVSTRGHYSSTKLASAPLSPDNSAISFAGVEDHLLKRNRPKSEYDVADGPPGVDSESPEEITVFVHGWMASQRGALGRMAMMRYSLRENDYQHPVVGYTWDAAQPWTRWKTTRAIARRNGAKLAQFTLDYHEDNPDTRIRFVSNSIGDVVVFSALERLADEDVEGVVDTVSVLGGTTGSVSVTREGRYGEAIRTVPRELHSYRTERDRTLNTYYRWMNAENSIGGAGARGTTPDNYVEHHVDDVPDHFSFYVPERGCVDRVVEHTT